jgi:hypothetical protein
MHDPVIATGVVGFVVAGVFVGLGLRFRDMPPRSASLHTPQMM